MMKRFLLLASVFLFVCSFQACQTTQETTTLTIYTTTSTRTTTTTTTLDSRDDLVQVLDEYLFLLDNTMSYQYDLIVTVFTDEKVSHTHWTTHRVDKGNGRYLVSYSPPDSIWDPVKEYLVRDENGRYTNYQFFNDHYQIVLATEMDFQTQFLVRATPYDELHLETYPLDLPIQYQGDGVYKMSGSILSLFNEAQFDEMFHGYGFSIADRNQFTFDLYYYHNDFEGLIEQRVVFKYQNTSVLSVAQRFSHISNPVFGDVFEGYYFDIGTAADIHPYAQMGVEYKTPSTHSGNLKVILQKGVEYRLTFPGYSRESVDYIFLTTENYGLASPTKEEWVGDEFRFIVPSSGVYYIIMICDAGFRVIWEKVS